MTAAASHPILKTLLTLSSAINVAGGFVLIGAFGVNLATDPQHHVPPIVFAIGASMLIQAVYTIGYLNGWWERWGEIATGALLAGQAISGCVGLGMVVTTILAVPERGDFEAAPLVAGLLIGVNALIALLLLLSTNALVPKITRS